MGQDGNDTLSGGYGDDSLEGGLGNDVYIVDSINDQILENPSEGTDKIIVASYATPAVKSYFQGPNNRPSNIEISQYEDTLNGGIFIAGNDSNNILNLLDFTLSDGQPIVSASIAGLSGNDTIIGGVGQDSITGDTGDDSLVGGDENDNLIGGEGSDSLAGGTGNDTLNGNSGNDSLLGGRDNDVVSGGQGNDVVYGNLGNDSVSGNLDNDVIIGTSGQIANPGLGELDTLSGGTGLDRFVLADSTALYYKGTGNQDFALITDFSFTEGDRIELKSGINYQVAPVTVTSFPKGLGIFDGSDLIALVQNLTIADVSKLKATFTLI